MRYKSIFLLQPDSLSIRPSLGVELFTSLVLLLHDTKASIYRDGVIWGKRHHSKSRVPAIAAHILALE